MKKYIITLSSIVLVLSACGEYNLDNPYKPENGSIKTGTLTAGIPAQPAEGATFELDFYPEVIDFSWDAATFDGTGIAVSKVLIDTCGGDFSSPAASFGVSHPDTLHRALTQDQAKSIFKALSKAKENTLSASWCIASSAGGKTMLSAPRTIVLKMTPDPDPFVPGNPIYIAGTGTTEAGRNMVYLPNFINGWDSRDFNDNNYELAPSGTDSNGPKRMWINAGDNKFDYEIFTHLEAGGKLYFWSGGASLKNADWIFTPAEDGGFRKLVNSHDVVGRGDQLIKAPRQFCDTTFTVAESGEYRIRYSSASGEYIAQKFLQPRFRYWPGPVTTQMNYIGNGKWQLEIKPTSFTMGFKFLYWSLPQDQPHGFMNIAKYPLATINSWTTLDEIPEDFWYVCSVKGGGAQNNKTEPVFGTWPFAPVLSGSKLRLTLHMNDDFPAYKLDFEKID